MGGGGGCGFKNSKQTGSEMGRGKKETSQISSCPPLLQTSEQHWVLHGTCKCGRDEKRGATARRHIFARLGDALAGPNNRPFSTKPFNGPFQRIFSTNLVGRRGGGGGEGAEADEARDAGLPPGHGRAHVGAAPVGGALPEGPLGRRKVVARPGAPVEC